MELVFQIFREAARNTPSVIYVPHIVRWWTVSPPSVQETFITLLEDLSPDSAILLMATAESQLNSLPYAVSIIRQQFSYFLEF